MRKLRVLLMIHAELMPPETLEGLDESEINPWKMEYDVMSTLVNLGHEVICVGVEDDLRPVREAIGAHRPHIVFNLLMHFHEAGILDSAVVSWMELMKQPYTGCNPRGLLITKDKALSKKILAFHRIPSPRFTVFPLGRKVTRPKKLQFPIFVKSVIDDASLGISQSSVVHDDKELQERVAFVHEHTLADALAEEYIEGRELYVGVMGNERLQTFPIWELWFNKSSQPIIATRKVKWDRSYQEKLGVETGPAKDLTEKVERQISRICKRVYQALDMSGYARMDLRLRPDGKVYVLEANANPNLSYGEDFAESAETSGLSYEDLLSKIIGLGLRYRAPWKL